ncbi:aminoglycoside phosphotransferase [Pseudomonas endophytica]|uniref:Aminoglycoside 3'-phosphotransferase n=1 Tax=Pseudomonas endophytica TaxID=1563157 RepID=A0A0Q0YS52_9PSED|nr:APH(3') family aminoglycoside O-phosphotransferase [Pseudomonas endophytica]KQB51830.1 aminoglycoside phosphotransferase [Pseudomonas endophytica]
MAIQLPKIIEHFIGNAALTCDEIGESPCDVYSFKRGNGRFFLKICPAILAPTTYSVSREAHVLSWLSGRLSVPEVVAVASNAEGEFMITRCVKGEPLQALINEPSTIVTLFSEALHQLNAVPIFDCPFDSSAKYRLKELGYLVAHALGEASYNLQKWPYLHSLQDLLSHLHNTLPTEQRVFSHGDLCAANVFVDAQDNLHFIDLGRGGVADRWLDIALVHRNLLRDTNADVASEFLEGLGIGDNPAKREFFEQLDELF